MISAVNATRCCADPGCPATPVEQCGYVDRRGQACPTGWCAEHRVPVAGLSYCRRHAGTIRALGSKANNPRALPDVGNRGASLVRWVYRDLDEPIAALLDRVATPEEHLLRDSEVQVASAGPARNWEMSWKLASAKGVRLRITLLVAEEDDSVVHVRLNEAVVASGTPPWIEVRRRGGAISETEDRDQRRTFYEFLVTFLGDAVARLA